MSLTVEGRVYEQLRRHSRPHIRTWETLPPALTRFLVPMPPLHARARFIRTMEMGLADLPYTPDAKRPTLRLNFMQSVISAFHEPDQVRCATHITYQIGPHPEQPLDRNLVHVGRSVRFTGSNIHLLTANYEDAIQLYNSRTSHAELCEGPLDLTAEMGAIAIAWQPLPELPDS